MKRVLLVCVLFLAAATAWADWGLSNVVRKEIHRTVPASPPQGMGVQTADDPAQAAQGQGLLYTKTTHYPYTIHIASSKDAGQAQRLSELTRKKLAEMVFITKINLGAPGIWYRIDYGAFSNIKDAVLKLQELKGRGIVAKDAFVGGTVPYAIELGLYKSRDDALAAAGSLSRKGVVPYVVKEKEDLYRLLSGAYPDEKSAAPALSDLMALNLQPALKKR